jgi:hypothetical protein
MRRGFSIFLILFFGLGPLSALVDSSQDAGLPACCRRHGAHHCAMSAEMAMRAEVAFDRAPSFSAPPTCPLYHGPTFSMLMPAHALTTAAAKARAECTRTPAPAFERIAALSTPSRAYAGRGPPASNPS